MKTKLFTPALSIFTVLLLLFHGGRALAADTHGIPNFAQVEPGIWRGGQPTPEGWKYLKSIGVKRDLKLNTERESSDAAAKINGIEVICFPIPLSEQTIHKPKSETLSNAVNAIKPDGTYIHCEHGQDRTGLVVGIYRVKVQHWTKAAAYAEMKAHGFHPVLRGLQACWLDADWEH